MSVFVAVRQDKRKTANNLWYGRTYCPNIIDTHELAKRIEANVSVKESDVYAVLIEMAEVMAYEIANSSKIHLERLGYFYPAVSTSGALTKDEWSIAEHIKSGRVRFTPEYTRSVENAATGKSSGLSSRAISGTGFDYKIIDLAEKVKPKP
jgi:predicted histone-like DNA-binding protein